MTPVTFKMKLHQATVESSLLKKLKTELSHDPKSLWMVTASMKLKDAYSLEEKR